MAQITTLKGAPRVGAGTGAARAIRRAGRVPAVIYGNKLESVLISLDPVDLKHQLRGPGFFSRVFDLDVEGDTHRVLARDLQLDPVSGRPIHVDFMRFSADTKINVDVQVIFENESESPGIKRGGVLNVVRHAIELLCSPDSIPESISIDLTGLDIGDSVHVSVIELPVGVELTITDRDFTVATVAAPTVMQKPEEEEEEEAVEGEEELEGEEGAEGEEAPAEGEEPAEGEAETKE